MPSCARPANPRPASGAGRSGSWPRGSAVWLRDKTRPSRIRPLGQAILDRVVALTNTEPPHEATHWTAGAMAEAVGVSASSVQRSWRAHQLRPHRFRAFKLSNDPAF